ncbi:molecular chaperone DnaK [Candidatus Micrarchaeota archaeon]|nr:molecular chaperone DnaK [Candidatus Micrarchaeota archaeon]
MSKIIGIDLGTSNSAAAVIMGGKPTIIPSAEGMTMYGKAFPSVVALTKDGQLLVGEPARRQAVTNPDGTISGFKRKMGTDYKYKIRDREFTPQELSSFILQKIKKDAEEFLGEKVEKAVITVPAYFNDNQRQATKDAGRIAGLDVVRIINEPTAAALAYGIDKSSKEEKILVFDFGGGTLDVTILEFGEGVFEVISTSGDTNLGGRDMDKALTDYLIQEIKKEHGADVSKDSTAMARLTEAAEKAKIELSTVLETEINLPYLTVVNNQPIHFVHKLTRAKLEDLVRPIIDKCKIPMNQALQDAKLGPDQITKIILVGGPTRMPIVQKFVEDFIGRKAERGIDPMEAVAIGAALQGGIIGGEVKDVVLLDVTPLSLGIETLGGVFTVLIPRNTTIPTKKTEVFSTAADNQTSVEIKVYQGERPMAADNTFLGSFVLSGIPPAPRGMPQIEVTFDIDVNGILNVSAKDKATGKEQKIVITAPHKMNEDEIEQKIKEAEKFAEQDKKRKEFIETKNNAESLVYSTRKALEEYGAKVPQDVKGEIEKKIKELEDVLKDAKQEDTEKIKNKIDELSKVVQKIGASMYKNPSGTPPGQGPESPGKKPDDDSGGTINGEFKKEE